MRSTILVIAGLLTLAAIGVMLAGEYRPEYERPLFAFFLWMFTSCALGVCAPTLPKKGEVLQIAAIILAAGMLVAAFGNTLFWAYHSNVPWGFTSYLWMFASGGLWVRAASKSQPAAQP